MSANTRSGGPVLVSACLAGRPCRYDGSGATDDVVSRLVAEGLAVLVCPEVDGGLGTPRPPAEIVGGDGADVLAGRAKVVTAEGIDVTEAYLKGARRAVESARRTGADSAILKARSPSCGCGEVYDGTFSRVLQQGDGVTAAMLKGEGIGVLTDEEVVRMAEECHDEASKVSSTATLAKEQENEEVVGDFVGPWSDRVACRGARSGEEEG